MGEGKKEILVRRGGIRRCCDRKDSVRRQDIFHEGGVEGSTSYVHIEVPSTFKDFEVRVCPIAQGYGLPPL